MRISAGLEFPWKVFFSKLYEKATEIDIFSNAAQVAFYFTFALFPLLYFLISLFGILLDSSDGLRNELFSYLRQVMPVSVFDLVRKTVDEIVANSSSGKATLGLFITLWSASAGVDAIRVSLNSVYNLRDPLLVKNKTIFSYSDFYRHHPYGPCACNRFLRLAVGAIRSCCLGY